MRSDLFNIHLFIICKHMKTILKIFFHIYMHFAFLHLFFVIKFIVLQMTKIKKNDNFFVFISGINRFYYLYADYFPNISSYCHKISVIVLSDLYQVFFDETKLQGISNWYI